jgi:AhpD family alkylhydroperoxidase
MPPSTGLQGPTVTLCGGAKGTMETKDAFDERRRRQNERLLRSEDRTIKRFLALDRDAYADGAVPKKYKELAGLAASVVLRCDDCVRYHLDQAWGCAATEREIVEVLGIALVVGGSITIPHVRRAFEYLEMLGQATV